MMDKSKDLEQMNMLEDYREAMGLFSEQNNPNNPIKELETLFDKFEAIKSDFLSNQDFDKTGKTFLPNRRGPRVEENYRDSQREGVPIRRREGDHHSHRQ